MSLPHENPSESTGDKHVVIEEKNSKGEVIKKFLKGRFLGKGGFAKCYEFTNIETKKIVAAKIIPKVSLTKSRAKQKLMSEIKIHKSLHHQNIVNFEHFFEDNENVYILVEICPNQTMSELVHRRKYLTELEVQCYMIQILHACKYLHSNRVIHRDLKLGNLFLSETMEIKLGDFGLATKLEYEGERKRTICGTPNYIAPEILDGKNGHSYEVDIWSIGVIFYTLLIGKPPFETPDVKTTYRKIRMNSYSFPDHITISPAARTLISRILVTDPSKRPTIDEILNHEFFNNGSTIPKILPASTLAFPPSGSYIRQFLAPEKKVRDLSTGRASPQRLESTAPAQAGGNSHKKDVFKERKDLVNTDKIASVSSKIECKPTMNNANNIAFGKSSIQSNDQANNNNKIINNQGLIPVNNNNINTQSQNLKNTGSNNPNGFGNILSGRDMNNYDSQGFTPNNKIENILSTKSRPTTSRNGTRTLSAGPSNPQIIENIELQGADIWVIKWIDYSSKYGIGYILNNGCKGVFFNDSTKILMHPMSNDFLYVERHGPEKQDLGIRYTIDDYPKDLQKKFILLQHFSNYLDNDSKNKNTIINNNILDNDNRSIYVKKWIKTKHAILFRLSNKIVQVIFHQDQTEIILSSKLKIVTYMNKKCERLHFQLNTALESTNQEMVKRLKYTKDLLTQMLNINNNIKNTPIKNNNNNNNDDIDQFNIPNENLNKNEIMAIPRSFSNSGKKLETVGTSTNLNIGKKENNNQLTRSSTSSTTFIGIDKKK